MRYNERGEEMPDDTPIAVPLGFGRPESLQEQIRRFVRRELSAQVASQGFESFEEADDFAVDDDDDFVSRHELSDMQEERPIGGRSLNEVENYGRKVGEGERSAGKGGSADDQARSGSGVDRFGASGKPPTGVPGNGDGGEGDGSEI